MCPSVPSSPAPGWWSCSPGRSAFSAGCAGPEAALSVVGARVTALRIGLTGGIGSGKSTVGAMLASLGAVVIDTDLIARRLTLPGGGAIDAIRAAFGTAFIDASGALDRPRMRQAAFDDPATRARL